MNETIKIRKIILWAFLSLALLNIAFAHEDEFGEFDSMHFFHTGKLVFPVWTYWAEIVEHFAIVLAVAIGLILAYAKLRANEKHSLFLTGFILILVSETFTLLHHFLVFPFGIFNAVFHHGLLFTGILFLVLGIIKLAKEDEKR